MLFLLKSVFSSFIESLSMVSTSGLVGGVMKTRVLFFSSGSAPEWSRCACDSMMFLVSLFEKAFKGYLSGRVVFLYCLKP